MSRLFDELKKEMPATEIEEMQEFFTLSEDLDREQLNIIAAAMFRTLSIKNKRNTIDAISGIKNFKGDDC